jgi:hypothetical protein
MTYLLCLSTPLIKDVGSNPTEEMGVTHAWTFNNANVHIRLGEQWQQRALRQARYLKFHAPKLTSVTEKVRRQ